MNETKFNDIAMLTCEVCKDAAVPEFLKDESTRPVQQLHRQLDCYDETPLVELKEMAKSVGVRSILVKDESHRFGLKAFKGLGGIYALFRVICKELGLDYRTTTLQDLRGTELAKKIESLVFATTTDGNHGKGVAWAAAQFGCEAHIFMPAGTVPARVQAIRDINPKATVKVMDIGYDDTVRLVSKLAKEQGWHLVQDTSWDGYEEIPRWLIQGYSTMVKEASEQMSSLNLAPTHVFVQSGVGSMPAGVVGCLANIYKNNNLKFAVVEPDGMACIYASAKAGDGRPHPADPQIPSVMAGLNCGEPCTIAWPILRDFSSAFFKCPNKTTEEGMRLLASPEGADQKIISGESGAVCVGLINSLTQEAKDLLGIDNLSVILCFSTEGDTDPENYRRVVGG